MFDFTTRKYIKLIKALADKGYQFQTLQDYFIFPQKKVILLRHDVDARKLNSLHFAKIQHSMGIRGTYYFRMVPESYDEKVISEIWNLGHEIGYHYEDMYFAFKKFQDGGIKKSAIREEDLYDTAFEFFKTHLDKMRKVVPVKTMSMHGSPMGRFDNKSLWKKYNYKDFGIIGEPYLDIDFLSILYLTDTGRMWNGDRYNIRDKIPIISPEFNFRTTMDIVNAITANGLPERVLFTFHPQRWNDNPILWTHEFIYQSIKNQVKRLFFQR
jgi:hypothetical protein